MDFFSYDLKLFFPLKPVLKCWQASVIHRSMTLYSQFAVTFENHVKASLKVLSRKY